MKEHGRGFTLLWDSDEYIRINDFGIYVPVVSHSHSQSVQFSQSVSRPFYRQTCMRDESKSRSIHHGACARSSIATANYSTLLVRVCILEGTEMVSPLEEYERVEVPTNRFHAVYGTLRGDDLLEPFEVYRRMRDSQNNTNTNTKDDYPLLFLNVPIGRRLGDVRKLNLRNPWISLARELYACGSRRQRKVPR
jgi:hypothetical protein